MNRPQVNRRDLLLCLDQGIPPRTAAQLCGYKLIADSRQTRETSEKSKPLAGFTQAYTGKTQPVPEQTLLAAMKVTVNHQQFTGATVETGSEVHSHPYSEKELEVQYGPPPISPLMPWSRLWPFLHQSIGRIRPGQRLDLKQTVRLAAAAQPLTELPHQPIQCWAAKIRIIIDQNLPVGFIDDDVAFLVEMLTQVSGRQTLVIDWVTSKTFTNLRIHSFPTLVLSDLGQLSQDQNLMSQWLDLGRRLKASGIVPLALVPCPRERWLPQITAIWSCALWDRHAQLPPPGTGQEPIIDPDQQKKSTDQTNQLLTLLAPVFLIEPSLLRSLRTLLRKSAADIGTEYDVRVSQATARAGKDLALLKSSMGKYAEKFKNLSPQMKRRVAEYVIVSHKGYSPLLSSREVLNLHDLGTPLDKELVDNARDRQIRANDTMARDLHNPEIGHKLGVFDFRIWEILRIPTAARHYQEVAWAWVMAGRFKGWDTYPILEGMDPEQVRLAIEEIIPDPGHISKWDIRYHAGRIELVPWQAYSLEPPNYLRYGQPLNLIHMRRLHVQITVERESNLHHDSHVLTAGKKYSITIGTCNRVQIRSDCTTMIVEPCPHPLLKPGKQKQVTGDTSFAWDQYGLSLTFTIKEQVFKLRWIPPGTFLMGSPEHEPGRSRAEGPQHRVTIESGFWMGVTPVTQEQYQLVTGKNPSRFTQAGPQAPVEQVTWQESRNFCGQLTQLVPEFKDNAQFRLPSEAEWEYACRAGAETTLYTGPIAMKGERNAPDLDPIAWYGGNSGVDYEGGYDSSDWEGKQFDHKSAGTHPVGEKQPNAWGLYDMLGNVWEWCADTWHDDYSDAPDNELPWILDEEGRYRVIRGGGCFNCARDCRCACRYRLEPGDRYDFLGFRFVLAPSQLKVRKISLAGTDESGEPGLAKGPGGSRDRSTDPESRMSAKKKSTISTLLKRFLPK